MLKPLVMKVTRAVSRRVRKSNLPILSDLAKETGLTRQTIYGIKKRLKKRIKKRIKNKKIKK